MKVTRETEVEIVNLFTGSLVLEDRLGNPIILGKYGDADWVQLGDLAYMKNNLRYLFEAGIVGIVDDYDGEVLKFMRLTDDYVGTLLPHDFEELIKTENINALREELEGMNKNKIKTISQTAALYAKQGKLDSATVRDVFIKASGNQFIFDVVE